MTRLDGVLPVSVGQAHDGYCLYAADNTIIDTLSELEDIAHAVNAHDALVAACTEAYVVLANVDPAQHLGRDVVLDMIDKALALAKEKRNDKA